MHTNKPQLHADVPEGAFLLFVFGRWVFFVQHCKCFFCASAFSLVVDNLLEMVIWWPPLLLSVSGSVVGFF